MLTSDRLPRIAVFSNPLSGGNRKGLGAVREILAQHPRAIHREVRTPAEVATALADLAGTKLDVLAINGGDGTIQAVLTALFHNGPLERLPLLAVLRSGTDSVIARDVGLPKSGEKALRRLLNWGCTEERAPAIQRRSILRVQASPDLEPRYGMIFGAAAIYQGIQFCRRRIHTLGLRGELAPGLTLARFLLALARRTGDYVTPVPITISLDQHCLGEQEFLVVLISTLERYFLGLRPYWGTENGPLRFTAVTARHRHLLRALPSLLRGHGSRYGTPEHGYFSHNLHEVRLVYTSGFTLDGELYASDSRLGPVVVREGGRVSFLRL